MLTNSFALKCLSIVPDDFQDNVNDANVGVNEGIFFSFVCRMTQINPGGTPHMKGVGMLVGHFELKP